MILLIIPLIIALVILLQIFLSRRKNKWFGLILPGISGTFSIITILGVATYAGESCGEIIMQSIILFLTTNILTSIFLAIYFGCRKKLKKTKEIEKMNIQDLE
ncbi:hypothetical protein IAI10_13455 [Clostridium sp. 19966]|nr:hypothetical protein [Clostridium sp. 19966]